jgi:WD40 repeat protein
MVELARGMFVHEAMVGHVVWSADGERLWTAADGVLACWSRAGERLWTSPMSPYSMTACVEDVARGLVYVPLNRELKALDVSSGQERWRMATPPDVYTYDLALAADGALCLVGGYLEVWRVDVEAQTMNLLATHDNGNGCGALASSPDCGQVALRVNEGIWIVDTATGALVAELAQGGLMKVSWPTPDRIVATGSFSPQLYRWEREEDGAWEAQGGLSMMWGRCTALATSPDGALGLMTTTHGQVACLGLDDAMQRWRLTAGGQVASMAVSPDGQVLALANGQRVELRDVATGAVIAGGAPLPLRALALSADGAQIFAGYAADAVHALILDAQTLEVAQVVPQATVGAALEDGRWAVGGSYLAVGERVLDVDIRVQKSWGERPLYKQVAPVPGGRWLVASAGGHVEGRLELWDLHEEALHKTLVKGGMKAPGSALAASPDGAYVAVLTEGKTQVSLYDTASWKKVDHKPNKGQAVALAWSPDGALLYGVTAKGAVWAMAPDGAVRWEQAHKKTAWTALAAGGDAVVVGDAAGQVRVLDGATGALRAEWREAAAVTALLLTGEGALYVATQALELRRVEVSEHVSGKKAPRVEPAPLTLKPLSQRWHTNPLVSVALSPDGRHVATGTWLDHDGGDDEAGELFVWEVETGACVRRISPVAWGVGWPGYTEMVQWSPDGQQIGAGWCTNAVGAWLLEGRAQSPVATHEITDGQSRPPSWSWRHDGQGFAITAWTGSRVGIGLVTHAQRHAATYGAEAAIREPMADAQSGFFPNLMAWSRDGRWLSACANDTLEIYDMASRALAHTLGVPGGFTAFDAAGELLARSEDGYLSVVDIATGQERWRTRGVPQGRPVFAPDASRVALVGEDAVHIVGSGSAVVMDGATPGSVESWEGVADRPVWAWSPDGARGALRCEDRIEVRDAATGEVSWSCEVEAQGVAWGAGDVLVIWSSDALWLWPVGAKAASKAYRRKGV